MRSVASRLVIGSAALLLALLPTPAISEGIGKPYKAPPRIAAPMPDIPPEYSWTGLYLGGAVGYLWSDGQAVEDNEYPDVFNRDNRFIFGELKAGYDVQLTRNLIAGVFGTWTPNMFLGTSNIDEIYSFGGRVGLVANNTLIYVGGAWVRMQAADVNLDGYAILAGFERPLFNTQALNLTWGLEYKYQDVEGSSSLLSSADDVSHSVMARLNLRLGGF